MPAATNRGSLPSSEASHCRARVLDARHSQASCTSSATSSRVSSPIRDRPEQHRQVTVEVRRREVRRARVLAPAPAWSRRRRPRTRRRRRRSPVSGSKASGRAATEEDERLAADLVDGPVGAAAVGHVRHGLWRRRARPARGPCGSAACPRRPRAHRGSLARRRDEAPWSRDPARDGALRDFRLPAPGAAGRSSLVGLVGVVAWGRLAPRHRRPRSAVRRGLRRRRCGVVAVGMQAYQLTPDDFDVDTSLPFQLCDVATVAAVVALWTRSPSGRPPSSTTSASTLTMQGDPHAVLAEAFPHPRFFGFWALHFLVVWAAVYLTWGLGIRPTWRRLPVRRRGDADVGGVRRTSSTWWPTPTTATSTPSPPRRRCWTSSGPGRCTSSSWWPCSAPRGRCC